MRIVDLTPTDETAVRQTAALLVDGFREHWPEAWPTIEAALAEVHESSGEGRISRIAVDESSTILGWIGGIRLYSGRVWEIHPLVVHSAHRRRGIGRALVADLEDQVRARGGLTLWLGTDDEFGQTTVANVDLYPNPLEHLTRIRNLKGHPFEFYQKVGFVLAGILPDANGYGKPDIFMAKRVQP